MNTENVSTLKIHKLTKAQYERELGAGRIDPTAIYLTPNEEVLSIEQGGTGANNATDALANLGAAPAGYGYGDAIPLIYISSDSGGVQTTAKIDEYFLALGNQMTRQISVCDPSSLGTGYVFEGKLYRMNENEGTLEMFAADGTAVKRCKVSGVWGDWIDVSPSAFAPSGYGLGATFPQSISSLADLDTLTRNGWYVVSASASTLAGVYFNHAMVFVQCRYGSVYQELVPIKSVSKVCRYLYDGEWSEWTNISPSAFAPSGYGGYGETCPYFIVTNETDFESELTNIVNNIQPKQSVRFTFMIGSIAGVTIGDWQWIATIHKTSAKYAFVSAQCGFGSRITKIEKVLTNGVWQPCEWENPPMIAGVEYRTTERVGDRPVYAYLFNYGYYSTDTTVIPHNLSVYQPVSIDITNNLQEILTNSSGIKELSFNRTNINISCDWNMGNVHFIMKYTK